MIRLFLLFLAGVAVGAPLTLVRDGKPVSTIVLAAEPTRTAQFAAIELQDHVRQITGAELPIVREPAEGTVIYVGTQALRGRIELKPFAPQEYVVMTLPNALVLAGLDSPTTGEVKAWDEDPFAFRTWPGFFEPHATLYAVYDFLETECGVRWFRPGALGSHCPQTKTLTVEVDGRTRAPAFKYREPSHWLRNSEGYDRSSWLWNAADYPGIHAELAAVAYPELERYAKNGWHKLHAKRGLMRLFLYRQRAGGEPYGCNHSFYGYYDRFYERSDNPKTAALFERPEPEWFAKGYEGRPPQMCYTNAEFTQQVIEDARAYFDGEGARHRAVAAGDYFALCPMDNSRYCKGDACQKWFNEAEKDNKLFSNGRWSDYIFQFCNTVAAAVGKTHPDKILSTLAYAAYAYPPSFKLEPNMSVGFCLHTRNIWNPGIQENDLDLFNRWMAQEPGRRYFLFLYYCFPQENADRGGFHCFPGFFAHGIADWFKRFNDNGVRGAYFCGWGQDVESYVTFKLMDDPSLDVDALLDEYFAGMYGPAAEPMKELYLEIERVYSTPDNYPEDFRGHQKEFVAWGHLGTAETMTRLGQLMAAARAAAADSPDDAARVALFERGIWDYMVAGRGRYLIKEWQKAEKPPRTAGRIPALTAAVADSNPAAVDFTGALAIDTWRDETAQAAETAASARLIHDGACLYAELADFPAEGDDPGWDLVLAIRAERPFQRLRVHLDGTVESQTHGAKRAHNTPASAISGTTHDGRAVVRVAVPLATMLPGGVEPGWTLSADVVRRRPDGHLHWAANLADAEEPAWFGHLALDSEGLPPAAPMDGIPELSEGSDSRELGPGATVRVLDVTELCQSNNDLIQGIPFAIEPVKAWYHWKGEFRAKDINPFTDARTTRAPTTDLFFSGAPEIALTWELPEPRRLGELRLFWARRDHQRNGARVKFAGRIADTGAWRDLSDWFEIDKQWGVPGNTYCVIALELTELAPMDAVRLVDGMGSYNTRFVELDVFAAEEPQ